MDASEMIQVNCVGAGRWGPNIIRCLRNLPHVRVRWVCDTDPARLKMLRERMPDIATTTDVDEVIFDDQADAIVIATPVHTHFDLAQRSLRAGRHVFIEKPLCPTAQQCETLSALADHQDRILAVGHVFLFNVGIRKIREVIRGGHLGRVQYIFATRTNLGPIRRDVNALWDLASHDLSIFRYWLQDAPVEVTAHGQRFLPGQVEDVVVASYRYPGDVLACVHASWLNPRKVREITVVGDRRMAVWNDLDPIEPVRIHDKTVEMERRDGYTDSLGDFQGKVRDGDVWIPHVGGGEPLATECEHFINCIRQRTAPINDAELATGVVRALEAADESLRQGGGKVPIASPPNKPDPTPPEPTLIATPSG